MEDTSAFCLNYTHSNESKISFAWNGKHAEEFVDTNLKFRRNLIEFVIKNLDSAPFDLIKDLYKAETLFAKEAWGVNNSVLFFAETILRRGTVQDLDDFVSGYMQSFDTDMCIQGIKLPNEILQVFAKECSRRLLDPQYGSQKKIYESLLNLFSATPTKIRWFQRFMNWFSKQD